MKWLGTTPPANNGGGQEIRHLQQIMEEVKEMRHLQQIMEEVKGNTTPPANNGGGQGNTTPPANNGGGQGNTTPPATTQPETGGNAGETLLIMGNKKNL